MLRPLFAIGLAGALLAACTRADPVTEMADGMLYAGAGQNGGAVAMQVGQMLRVELESIPTAGYIWQITDQPDVLELVTEGGRPTHPEAQNQPGFTGGNHFLSFDFKAAAPGAGRLELVEGRPWELEAGDAPIGRFHLDVTVVAAP